MIDWKPIETVPRGKDTLLHNSSGAVWCGSPYGSDATHWAEYNAPKPVIRTVGDQEVRVHSRRSLDPMVGFTMPDEWLDRKNWELLKAAGDEVFDAQG
jgi:hypothetical protein